MADEYDTTDVVGDAFVTPSTFEHPVARLGAGLPMPFNNAPDCAYGGFGTGGETIEADGTITTRWKGHGGSYDDGTDGGAP